MSTASANVPVEGESGAGKALVARALHFGPELENALCRALRRR